MSDEPKDSDLLAPFEIANITGEYRDYYKAKRNNFRFYIQEFTELWEQYQKLDAIWLRELRDIQSFTDETLLFPAVLFVNAHAKIRISVELAFAGCLQEARSLLRDAIECVAHGHHMLKDPELQRIWTEKDKLGGAKIFQKAFQESKKDNLFAGLGELHTQYGRLSETGSHPTLRSLANRVVFEDTLGTHAIKVNYTGVADTHAWATEVFTLLCTCSTMERAFFNDFELRLQLDDRLTEMRRDFQSYKETLRQTLIVRYNIQPPKQSRN
jgi:hypothetical protein